MKTEVKLSASNALNRPDFHRSYYEDSAYSGMRMLWATHFNRAIENAKAVKTSNNRPVHDTHGVCSEGEERGKH